MPDHPWSGNGVDHSGFGSENWAKIDLSQNRCGHWVVKFDREHGRVGEETLFKASKNQRGDQLEDLQMPDATVGLGQ